METEGDIRLRIYLLGPYRLEINGECVPYEAWRSKRALNLFRYLVTQRGKKVRKELLLDTFWLDDDPNQASQRLYSAIHFARRMLEPDLKAYRDSAYIKHSNGMYWFDQSSPCWIDADAFEQLGNDGQALETTDQAAALDYYRQALAHYRGDFMAEDMYDDWIIGPRDYFRELYIARSVRKAHLLIESDRVAQAIAVCRQALSIDPYREELHRALVSYLIQAGQHAEAVAQYRQLVSMLATEFGLEPSPETQALLAKLKGSTERTRGVAAARPRIGPLICERTAFDAIHALALRGQMRHGEPTAQLTIGGLAETLEPSHLDLIVRLLDGILRPCDVLCRERDRILVQLLQTEKRGSEIVKERIERKLDRRDLPAVGVAVRVFESTARTDPAHEAQ